MERAVLVVGGGVGGMAAALELAGSGFPVYLAERSPGIGGTAIRMDRWFPDDVCQLCQLLPQFSRELCSSSCLRQGLAHPNIALITNARVESVRGDAGDFQATLEIRSPWVRAELCTACGRCVAECPVEVPDELDCGLTKRKAIGIVSPMATPHAYAIDRDNCNRCGKCVALCPTGAIDLSLPDESRDLAVGAIVVSGGSELFNPARMGQYGFGRYPNVITSLQMERMLDPAGSRGGKVLRPSDGQPPRRVAFLQCVGSRDRERDYCSTVCCMSALKEAMLFREQDPQAHVEIFHMDIRDHGKGYHRYYRKARDTGIGFTMCRVPVVRQRPGTGNLTVLAQDGGPVSREFEMVVLSVGQCASPDAAELSRLLGVGLNRWGFIEGAGFWPVRTAREGIYVCGSATAPADIAETVSQAGAAACQVAMLLGSQRGETKAGARRVLDEADPRTAVFVCRCGDEVASVEDMPTAVDFARRLPDVVHAEDMAYPCLPAARDRVRRAVADSGANRVVFAACAPYRHRLESLVRDAGIDPARCQVVNIREEVVWVHRGSPALATDKAQRMLALAVERVRAQEPVAVSSREVNRHGLVIGGGASGMVAALSLAGLGLEVSLVERSAELGGHTRDRHYRLGDGDPQAFLRELCQRVRANPRIHLYLESEVVATTGYAGGFHTTIKTAGAGEPPRSTAIDHGAAIIATGAEDYRPAEYLYGRDERILTGRQLHGRLADGSLGRPATVLMVQCVGSRDRDRPYCSRTCCVEAIASSLRIKEQSPPTEVFILYRDLMTCGFDEQYYTQAREAGVLFVRYEPDRPPAVTMRDGAVLVAVDDPVLREEMEIRADLVVLSTGIVPAGNRELADIFGVELNEDGFFNEASRFRPVDTSRDGIFICGRANAPVSLEEAVVQAQAAAQRAAGILGRARLCSGTAISRVNERRCRGCGLCVTACAYSAREIDEDRKVAVVREALCRGCGSCVAVCPNGAAELTGLRQSEVFSMLETALKSGGT